MFETRLVFCLMNVLKIINLKMLKVMVIFLDLVFLTECSVQCRALDLSEDNSVPPDLLVAVRVTNRGRLESVSLQAGQPQAGSEPGQVNPPAVRERFTVQLLAGKYFSF